VPRSSPKLKCSPAKVSTTTRTDSSASGASKSFGISPQEAGPLPRGRERDLGDARIDGDGGAGELGEPGRSFASGSTEGSRYGPRCADGGVLATRKFSI
jgi:hypothetical protein